jgi:CRISPR/Cas system-associated exonuclease Cas4 (RecB family)
MITNEDMNKIINKTLEQTKKPRIIGHYNCSELDTCYRDWYWRYVDPIEPSHELLRIFNCGHSIHSFIDGLFEESEDTDVIENERAILMVLDDVVLHGRLDNLVNIKDEDYIIDTKSTKRIGDWPLPEGYKMQLMPYMKAMNVPRGGILYVEKNTFKTKFVPVEYSEETFQKVRERVNNIHYYLKNEILPPPEKKGEWNCRYCSYAERCKNVENGL